MTGSPKVPLGLRAPLRFPLHKEAPAPVDQVMAQRLYRGIMDRRTRRRHSPRRGAMAWLAAGALAGTVLTVGVELSLHRHVDLPAGPLLLADGAALGPTTAPADGSRTTKLADGSYVVLAPGTKIEPLENTGHVLSFLFAFGRATFDVHPGGPRRWSFECGLATVEVVGTRLTIDRTPERLVVSVEHGLVLVRGERVPDRVQRLGAGQRLEVRAPAPAELPAPAAKQASPQVAHDRVAHAAPHVTWRELSTRGDYDAAYRELGAQGVGIASNASQGVDELMALADVARLSGHPSDAIAPLTRVVRQFSTDPHASFAAFTLGKIRSTDRSSLTQSANDFLDAIRLGLPASLTEDAYANAVEVLRRAGDEGRARAIARDYAARFPASGRARALADWANEG